ncbi:MAG: lipopolysaccharide kinase InaA family protein, partial [Thermodesulfobacteriota bacterium]|nr:lipopolysaccharide kinase InaA family protein [Thermodesulfobacteriota bacterium]
MEYYIRKIDGISWMIKSDAPEAVTDHIIPSIPEIFHSDSFHTVRKYPPRTTGWVAYQHNGKDERLFIKDFGKFQGFKRFFFLWKISPAEKEGRVANFLTLRGINVVSPLAWGEKRSGRMLKACYLITKEIKDSMVLSNYLDNEWQKKDIETKSKEIKSLAYFMWRLHQNGVIQRDLHMDNLLIKVYKNNRVQPILFDLHKVKIKNKINSGEIIDNLTLLNFSSLHKLGRNIRYRFLHEYIKVSQTRLPEIKTIIKGINKKTGRRLFSFFKKRQKRCIKENKYFARYHKGHLKGFYLRSGSLDLIEILDQIEKVAE